VASSRALAGGFSRSTLFVELSGTRTLPAAVVIRRDGQVLHSGNSVGFEYPILKELSAAGLPVPMPLAAELSGQVLGRPFLVVSRLEGTTFGDTIDVSIQDHALCLDLARQLARLHRVPADRFGHVHGSGMRIVDRVRGEIEADRQAWRAVGPPCLPMDAAFAWLARNMDAADGPVALVHRDIGGHNMLAHDHRIHAILDWEIAVVGNPAEDLGYARYTIAQLGDWDAFLDAYSEAAGWRPPEASLDFYTLWGAVRLGVLIGKARAGVRSGQLRDLGLVYVSEHFMPRFISRVAEMMGRLLAR
jgi:aminoglycoside phosphotransferase (APT) family kinase protein